MQYQTMQAMPFGGWGAHGHNDAAGYYFAQQQQMMQVQNPGQFGQSPKHSAPIIPRKLEEHRSQLPRIAAEIASGNDTPSWNKRTPSPEPNDISADTLSAVLKDFELESPKSIKVESPSKWQALRNLFSPCSAKDSVMRSILQNLDGQVSLSTGTCCLPHPDKIGKGGEDAYIVRECDGVWLTGVLDGVGSWVHFGVDSSIYSRTFAQRIADEFVAWCQGGRRSIRKPLLAILENAFTQMQNSEIQGSCTVVLTMLFPNGELHVLNLGDSGVRVVRGKKIVFASKEQQVAFNSPRQLGGVSLDIPSYGDYSVIKVQPADTLLIASDGAWDNLWQHEWMKIVQDFQETNGQLAHLAKRLCEEAQKHGNDDKKDSPFAASARKARIPGVVGGKLDDTTMVVAQIQLS